MLETKDLRIGNYLFYDFESYKPIKIEKDFFLKFDNMVLLKEFEHKKTRKINYLHEFQNIYFSIIGKQIEIEM